MSTTLKAKVTKKTSKSINIEIDKDSFESFCNAIGLYRKEFLKELEDSAKDHREGRVKRRRSLYELIPKDR